MIDLFDYIEGTRRTRSTEQISKDTVFETIGVSIYEFDYQFVMDAVFEALAEQNAIANAAFGLVAEINEFTEIADSQAWFVIEKKDELIDELGDVWWYAATLIDTLPMQLSLEDRANLFFHYYFDDSEEDDEITINTHIKYITSMGKKIVAHDINPNEPYKDSGVTFNEIFMRHLADLLRKLQEEINFNMPYDMHVSLQYIWKHNLNKLQVRHPDGFDGSYNYSDSQVTWTEQEIAEDASKYDELSAALTEEDLYISSYALPVTQDENPLDWNRVIFP